MDKVLGFIVLLVIFVNVFNYCGRTEKTPEVKKIDSIPEKQVKTEMHIAFDCRITTYQPTALQCDSDSMFAAGGEITEESYFRWVGLSPDLLENFRMGDSIFLDFFPDDMAEQWNGWYLIKDKTNANLVRTVDILIPVDYEKGFCVRGRGADYDFKNHPIINVIPTN